MKNISLNRTTLSVLILTILVVFVVWMILIPTEYAPPGGSSRTMPPATQTAPNNPGPTIGGG